MVPFPAVLGNESGSLAKAVLGDSIGGEAAIRHSEIDRLSPLQELFDELLAQFVNFGL